MINAFIPEAVKIRTTRGFNTCIAGNATAKMKAKWIYWVNGTKYKRAMTNKRSCPNCGEYRRIERLVTFLMIQGLGIFEPYRCKKCGYHFLVATGKLLERINKVGRDYPLDRTLHPDVPLYDDMVKEAKEKEQHEAQQGQ